MLTIHIRVNDATTGKPTPVRLHVSTLDGKYFAPFGHVVDFPSGRNEAVGESLYFGGKKFAYIDGACEIRLPTETPLHIEITKGPQYVPIQKQVQLGKGQMALRFAIERGPELPENLRTSADSRAHFLSPHAAELERQAEGLDWVNLLATVQHYPSMDGHQYPTIPLMSAFSGQSPCLPGVVVNTLNTHPALGRLGLLNSHRPVFPLNFGGIEDSDDWSLQDWCGQCHRKHGLTVWVDAFRPEAGLLGGESLIALVHGKIDAFEFDGRDRNTPFLPWWYRLLNAGLKVPLLGGSGKDSNRIPLGMVRTYTPSAAEYREWIEHVRAGRTVVSNGDAITLDVQGHSPGDSLTIPTEQRLRITANSPNASWDHLELIANGEVIAEGTERVEIEHALPEGGWIAARGRSEAKGPVYPQQPRFAHTSPVYVQVEGLRRFKQPAATKALMGLIEATRRWIETEGRFTQAKFRELLLVSADEALRMLGR